MMMGGKYLSYGDTLANTIKSNVQDNWVSMVAGVVLIPVVAKSVTKLIRKPVILPANRMLKSTGLDVKL
jgi:p-aminobenzoyl-glutamate transporter AbgT